jgi:small subunit ribosomal protein S18
MVKVRIRRAARERKCRFCEDKIKHIDYKDVALLRRFLSEKAKIKARRATGNCARHQRRIAQAVKRARHVGLLPYVRELYR